MKTQRFLLKDQIQKEYSFNLDRTINSLVVVISIGIVAHLIFLLLTNDENVLAYLSNIKIPYVLLILACLMANWIGHATRLVIWTRYLKQQFKFRDALRIAIYTELGAAITPTLIGGGPIKFALMIRNKLSTGKAGFLTLLNGLEDFIMYSTVLLIGFFHARSSIFKIVGSVVNSFKNNVGKGALIVAGLFVLWFLFRKINYLSEFRFIPEKYRKAFSRLINEMKGGWHEMLHSFNQVRKDGLRYLLVSVFILFLQWTCKFTVLILLLTALGIEFKPFQVYIQQWIVYLTMIFIPTPGASGGAEATFYLIFEKQLPKHLLPLITSTWRFFMYYLMLFIAVFLVQFIPYPGEKRKNKADTTLTQ